ncbi:endolytic transglycosylase MltG [bacterium]|nr:endolytic transglycosylase MltG [bacterium]
MFGVKTFKYFLILLFAAFIGLLSFTLSAYFWIKEMSEPVNSGQKHEVLIESGANTRKIASLLKNKNTIKSALLFRIYIKFLSVDNRLRPGLYAFSGKETINEVIQLLLRGNEKTISVTVPEGVTNKRIASIMHDSEICSINDFIEATMNPSITGRVFSSWEYIPEMEGLLFPDTYYFRKNTPAEVVVERMLRMTKHQIDKIFTKPLPGGLSQYEGCILASIIEEEAALDKERDLIASVFYNRLAKNQKLESCATVLYALGGHKSRILYEDLKVKSPYNTYLNTGLPPTPISNFGTSALQAVANPAKTDYLYFVSDNARGHFFSKTINEHNKNRHLYFKKRKN